MLRLVLVVLLAGCVDPELEMDTPRSAPAIGWDLNQAQGTATVTAADPGADWGDFAMRFDVPGQIDRDGRVQAMDNNYERLEAGPVQSGDRLTFCTDTGGELSASLSHPDSNSRVRRFGFSDVPSC